MRHIPEEELHAYLDQGLSRTQCVEIESHLAACASCQASRDGIAALRDRTTALLATLAPPRTIAPSFESLRRRADKAVSARRRRLQVLAWVASLVLAVGLGWSASVIFRPRGGDSLAARATSPAVPARTASRLDTLRAAEPAPRERRAPPPATRPAQEQRRSTVRSAVYPRHTDSTSRRADREAVLSVLNTQPTPELSKLDSPRASGEDFDGMWRTMSWDGAQAEAGKPLPHIDGLPVVQIQVQNAEGTRPVMVVAQQLASGQVIRTIEGSAADVSQLLARRTMSDVDSIQLRGDSTAQAAAIDPSHAMAMQVGDRMLAITGDLPSDSLRAMIRRINAEMRSK
jgi:hypothetical protein